MTSGSGNFTNSNVRVTENPLTGGRLGQSATQTGAYNSIGNTVVGTTVASTAATTSLGFFNLGNSVLAAGTYNVCNGGTYPTLKSFFDEVNASQVGGNLIVQVAGDCVETATAALNQWTESPASSNYTMTIIPDSAITRTISGAAIAANGPLVNFNGAEPRYYRRTLGRLGPVPYIQEYPRNRSNRRTFDPVHQFGSERRGTLLRT